ncbi:hypothetical protein SEVIR_8G149575v4 [Setaria viridis]
MERPLLGGAFRRPGDLGQLPGRAHAEPGKLAASRHVLCEYGNMLGATIIFVLDEIQRRRRRQDVAQKEADMFGCEWGLTLGIGPGVNIEMMLLRDAGNNQHSFYPSVISLHTFATKQITYKNKGHVI